MAISTDRAANLNYGAAIKLPVKAATTGPISLAGAQTIDGVSVTLGDRVLVKNQSASSANGVYDVTLGAWPRSVDFDGQNDIVQGTEVYVTAGTVNGGKTYRISTTSPLIGSSLAFIQTETMSTVSPAFSGTPTAPTASVDTATDQIATTAFVLGQAASATPVMDGAAAAGTATRFSRADHVHPSDTSRVSTATTITAGTGLTGGGALSGNVTLSLAAEVAGFVMMEQVTVTGTNTLANLTYTTNGTVLILYVNGMAFFPVGTSPAFSVSGKTITWLSTTVSLTTYDTVVAVYSY